ncbi:NAD(P)-binding domain protein [Metarhizium album ARSEF 1941]|uniref:NAD(P)-binding domain protein n=1 Tax=Metarhizium album (strain ARSEF 1941) TaxID=1081103 RepID=A0A0B2WTQ3_METAS|nr:NAD(P)-binding domain protein [Metarhizium album ARSEF 1941]KHN97039.1 NAD(P)-binding domain protein [Metarhizium album ARSEF 1941]
MATETAARKFFTLPFFAVVGASSNPAKFGHKVHAWYLDHGLNVTPVNPGSSSVTVGGHDYATVPDLSGLPNPKQTSVSIITAPPVTVKVLEEAKKIGIPGVWLQPGTFDDAVLKLALEQGAFEYVVYGDGGRGHDGWCVLVDGERAMKDAGKL